MIHGKLIALMKATTAISTLVSTRIWLATAPQEGRSYPFILLRRISEVRQLSHSGSTKVVEARYQIDCFGKTMTDAINLGNAVKNLLHGYRGIGDYAIIHYCKCENEIDLVDEDIGYQVALDFLITHYE